jgi:hypothetical protein
MEGLLLISLRILRAVNNTDNDQYRLGQRLLKLTRQREALLAALPGGGPQSAADKARWELVRYVNRISQQKIAEKI